MLVVSANKNYLNIGKITCFITFLLGLLYLSVTLLGFLSLNALEAPISDPYFTIMELLAIVIAPLMAVNMMAVHYHASARYKTHSLFALCCMFIMAAITSCVHCVVLTMSYFLDPSTLEAYSLFFSFKWPSVVYALDILAWDWFFALSFIVAAPLFNKGRLEKRIRALMFISGLLSLIGLLVVPLGDMQIRNIGIVGYAVMAPFVFLLIGINFSQIQSSARQ